MAKNTRIKKKRSVRKNKRKADTEFMDNKFEVALSKYKPLKIKYLLIAEAPPGESSNRFFYFEYVEVKDSLFIETMKVLYPDNYTDTKIVRSMKKQFLNQFKEDGFYLIDSTDKPMPNFKRSKKIEQIKASLPSLMKKISGLIDSDTNIILISSTVYEVCEKPLKTHGFKVINDHMIDFPGSGGQKKYREKMAKLLNK